MQKRIRSRIHEFFNESALTDLYKICNDKLISDNNQKVDAIMSALRFHNIEFDELGPGTNRLAVLIDNYVFKIAMDKWGMRDNLNEFTTSKELQPFVVKTYETNELISVCEYVTVISREEFVDSSDTIRRMLSIISEGYLLGDVGTVSKNFTNWGYRDNGELVILDYAYIYRIHGDEVLCVNDGAMLDYDLNFHNLICPKCKTKYSFIDIRRKVPMELEQSENEFAKEHAYKLNSKVQFIQVNSEDEEEEFEGDVPSVFATSEDNKKIKEEKEMVKHYDDYEEENKYEEDESDVYQSALEQVRLLSKGKLINLSDTETPEEDETPVNIVHVHRETEKEISDIQIITKAKIDDEESNPIDDALESLDDVSELLEEIDEDIKRDQVIADVIESIEEVVEQNIPTESITVIAGDVDGDFVESVTLDSGVPTIQDGTEVVIKGSLEDIGNVDTEFTNAVAEVIAEEAGDIELDAFVNDEETEVEEEVIDETKETHEGEVLDDDFDPMSQVILDRTIHVGDNIEINDKITVTATDDELIQNLRAQFDAEAAERESEVDEEGPTDEEEEAHIRRLAEEYMHMEEEAEDEKYGNKNNKDWK